MEHVHYREDSSVNIEKTEEKMVIVCKLLTAYLPDNIFNCDKIGLYWRHTQNRSLTVRICMNMYGVRFLLQIVVIPLCRSMHIQTLGAFTLVVFD
jgi:hypothetical protein